MAGETLDLSMFTPQWEFGGIVGEGRFAPTLNGMAALTTTSSYPLVGLAVVWIAVASLAGGLLECKTILTR